MTHATVKEPGFIIRMLPFIGTYVVAFNVSSTLNAESISGLFLIYLAVIAVAAIAVMAWLQVKYPKPKRLKVFFVYSVGLLCYGLIFPTGWTRFVMMLLVLAFFYHQLKASYKDESII
ncbi:MAG: hypothetical protein Q3972_01415 [Corynebacterium sp.]|nr:hypothetical protein [Corynebacterium sp.]